MMLDNNFHCFFIKMKVGFSYEQTESVIFISKIKWPFWGLHKEDIQYDAHGVYSLLYLVSSV